LKKEIPSRIKSVINLEKYRWFLKNSEFITKKKIKNNLKKYFHINNFSFGKEVVTKKKDKNRERTIKFI